MNASALLNCCQGDQGLRKLKPLCLKRRHDFHSFLAWFPVVWNFMFSHFLLPTSVFRAEWKQLCINIFGLRIPAGPAGCEHETRLQGPPFPYCLMLDQRVSFPLRKESLRMASDAWAIRWQCGEESPQTYGVYLAEFSRETKLIGSIPVPIPIFISVPIYVRSVASDSFATPWTI